MKETASLRWIEGKSLSELSTFRIGGKARYYVVVQDIAQLRDVLKHCAEQKLPFFILGKGSNSLFDQRGFDGVVIHNKIEFCEWLPDDQVRVGAGYSFSLLGAKASRKGLAGLEFASGIPASVGGAVYMNAGANKTEVSDVLVGVEVMQADGSTLLLRKEQLTFRYRYSSFQKRSDVIVAATFQLRRDSSAKARQREIVDYRMASQPYDQPSAGCVFRNPEGGHAGEVIERLGLKGCQEGDAQISDKHANFIVNLGAATADEVDTLIRRVQQRVYESERIALEPEIRRVPYQVRGECNV